jgi:hypothetical protein
MSKVDDLLKNGPPPAASTVDYLGVPKGYQANKTTRETGPFGDELNVTVPVAPRYTENDVAGIATLPTESIARLQAALYRAGVFTSEDSFVIGRWDDASKAAYRKVLGFANESGMDEREALNKWAELQAADPTGGQRSSRAPLVAKVSNPIDIGAAANKVMQQTAGRSMSPQELAAFTAAYQQSEMAAQRSAYNMAGGPGGTVTDTPDITTYAAEQARKNDPVGAQEMDLLKVNDTLMNALKGGG